MTSLCYEMKQGNFKSTGLHTAGQVDNSHCQALIDVMGLLVYMVTHLKYTIYLLKLDREYLQLFFVIYYWKLGCPDYSAVTLWGSASLVISILVCRPRHPSKCYAHYLAFHQHFSHIKSPLVLCLRRKRISACKRGSSTRDHLHAKDADMV